MSNDIRIALITSAAIYIVLVLAPPLSLQLLDENVGKHLVNKNLNDMLGKGDG